MAADQPILAILVMAASAYASRIVGYFVMGYVRVTPRVEAWLSALPMAVMGAILAPAAAAAGPAELAGFGATIGAYLLARNEIVGAIAGVTAVAVVRAFLA